MATTTTQTPGLIIRPLCEDDAPRWEQYVNANAEGTFFHTLIWRDAVTQTWGHATRFLIAERDGRIEGVLPLYLVRSFLAGALLVSVPYGVYGGIIAESDEVARALFEAAMEYGRGERVKMLDLRSVRAAVPGVPVIDRYVTFRRELPDRPEDVLAWLPRKTRAAARKGREKFRLTVSFEDANLRTVWDLYCLSMRRLGSLNYPYAFFEALVARTPGRHTVSLVSYEGRPAAGLVTFYHGDTAMPYFSGCDASLDRYCTNNFLYLTIMEEAVRRGCRMFDFGRSRKDNTGSANFKRFHGFEPRDLEYQQVLVCGERLPDLTPSNAKFRAARRLWQWLPLCATRRLGAWLSGAIPG
jgi:FemAB-related protein (PEP-CTERM system-associated)